MSKNNNGGKKPDNLKKADAEKNEALKEEEITVNSDFTEEEPADAAAEEITEKAETDTDKGDEKPKKAEKADKSEKVSFYKRRSFKYGSAATAFTAIFVAIVVVINIGLSVLSSRYPISFDLTKSKDYGISSDTFTFMKSVKAPIKITILGTQSQMDAYYSIPKKIIDQYPKYFSNVSIDYIDLEKNPTYTTKYASESLQQGDIIVTSGSKYKKISSAFANYQSSSDLYEYTTDSSSYSTTITGYKAEEAVDSAIEYVTSTTLPSVVFTQGHSEQGYTGYESFLKNHNYSTSEVNTALKAIDANASAAVICYPQSDFTSDEITKLDTFLTNGGKYGKSLLVFLDPREKSMPNLEEYVSEWGIKVGTGVVYDSSNSTSNSVAYIATDSVNSSVASDLSGNTYTLMPISRPLTLLFDSKDVRKTQYVVKSLGTSQLLEKADGTPSSADKKGEYIVMALGTKSSESDSTVKSNVLVSGSTTAIDSSLLSATNFNNGNLFNSLSNTLTNKKSTLNIQTKSKADTALSLTAVQRTVILLIFLILLPLAVIITGLVIWLRRRHL